MMVNNNEVIDLHKDDEKLTNKSDEKRKEIKVLLVKSGVFIEKYTLEVLPSYNELDIINTIFSNNQILVDDFGYKLVNDRTVRRVQMTAVNDPKRNYDYIIEVQSPTMKSQESDSFSNLLNSKKFSDVILCVNGVDIHAHKIILANKSPVFEVMFTHKMSETISNKVEIKDIGYDTMCDVLHFIYTGNLSDDKENDVFVKYRNLLKADGKYCVENLKAKCEEKLTLAITSHNVVDCLILADSLNALYLKKRAIDFFIENAGEIVNLPSYKNFVKLYPYVLVNIIRALALKQTNVK